VLSHLPYEEVPIVREEDFKESYQITLDIADRARRETDVKVFVTVGPYPVLLMGLEKKYGLSRATEIMKRGMETAQSLVREKRAVALGEIGRPHFPVTPELMSASTTSSSMGCSSPPRPAVRSSFTPKAPPRRSWKSWGGWLTGLD